MWGVGRSGRADVGSQDYQGYPKRALLRRREGVRKQGPFVAPPPWYNPSKIILVCVNQFGDSFFTYPPIESLTVLTALGMEVFISATARKF